MSRCLLYDVREPFRRVGWRRHAAPHARPAHPHGLAQSFDLHARLDGHSGCVNSIEFNDEATLLLTGSDDTNVCLYDTVTWKKLTTISTDHTANIFSAVMVPKTNNASLISCGLDGRTCMTSTRGDGSLASREFERSNDVVFRANYISSRLVFAQGDPHTAYMSSGNGGVVILDTRAKRKSGSFFCGLDGVSRSCDAICASPVNPHVLGVGTNLPWAYMVDTRFISTTASGRESAAFLTLGCHRVVSNNSGIGGMNFSARGDRIVVSYKSDDVYVYNVMDQVTRANRGKTERREVALYRDNDNCSQPIVCAAKRYYGRENSMTMFKEATFFDDDNFVVTGGDSGELFFWDTESTELVHRIKADSDIVNGVLTHPALPVVVTCGIDSSTKVFSSNGNLAARARSSGNTFTPPRMRNRRPRSNSRTDSDDENDRHPEMAAPLKSLDVPRGDTDDIFDLAAAGARRAGGGDGGDDESDDDLRAMDPHEVMAQSQAARHLLRVLTMTVDEDDLLAKFGYILSMVQMVEQRMSEGMEDMSDDDDGGDEEDEEEDEMDDEEGSEEYDDGEPPSSEYTGGGGGDDALAAAIDALPNDSREDDDDDEVHEDDDDDEEEEEESDGEDEEEVDEDDEARGASDDDEEDAEDLDDHYDVIGSGDESDGFDSEDSEAAPMAGWLNVMPRLLGVAADYTRQANFLLRRCSQRGILCHSDFANPSYRTALPALLSGDLQRNWRLLSLHLQIIYAALKNKAALCHSRADKDAYNRLYEAAMLHTAAFHFAEGDVDKALAFSCDAVRTWGSVSALTLTVAMLSRAKRSAAMLDDMVLQLRLALDGGAGSNVERRRGDALLASLSPAPPAQ
jgi:WD repeat-containing protein 42A